jgi:methionyl-tRNA formyltransferase
MKKFILLSSKEWHDDLFEKLKESTDDEWVRIIDKKDLNLENLKIISPDKIFIPHWSHIIADEIFTNFECVVFHMTDLPYGRGGSPLQNLIVNGFTTTKISALKVRQGIDTGDIYLKSDLDLQGTAKEIFIRASNVMFEMILFLLKNEIEPQPQIGTIVNFKRRGPNDSDVKQIETTASIYDYIRMLDCDGYPKAFIETDSIKFEFSNATFDKDNNEIFANVRIIQK